MSPSACQGDQRQPVSVGLDRGAITRWGGGTPLSRVIATGTRADRDRVGALLLRLLVSAPGRARRLHGDPHPGNFRLLPDRRLAVLDFGVTEDMPHGWPARLGPLLAGAPPTRSVPSPAPSVG